MKIKNNSLKTFFYPLLAIFAFYVNFYYGNLGLHPIDTFTFFDTGFNITIGKHPIKDIWIISGIFGDYLQALFFKLFGFNWNSYLYHSSTLNALVSLIFFIYLKKIGLKDIESFLFAISLSILCYPVAGTPFTYIHSYLFSLISIMMFVLSVFCKKRIFFFLLPVSMFISFLSMQLPSGIINIILIISFLIFYINSKKEIQIIYYFLLGTFFSLLLFIFYLLYLEIPFKDFLIQYVLFPLALGSERIASTNEAFESAKLINKLNFKSIILDFKFIHLFLFSHLFLIFFQKKFYKKNREFLIIDLTIIISSFAFIFHQLITANQIFIFSQIPFVSALLYLRMTRIFKDKNFIKFFFTFVLLLFTSKYHLEFNEKRKFMDLHNVDFNNYIQASNLDNKFNNLKWITPEYKDEPLNEIKYLKEAIKLLKTEKKEKMIITHYQFFSLILNEDLNILNRWYYPDNTFPWSPNHLYYEEYKKFFNNKIKKEKIEVIFIVMSSSDAYLKKYLEYLNSNCTYKKVNELTTFFYLKNCM
tara:strand:- start:662 stop:2251 length:1590 start_codon:yes stop_codon:yes gene_type:complete